MPLIWESKMKKQQLPLRRIREGLGLSATKMATALGYRGNRDTLSVEMSRLETGARPIPVRTSRLALMFHWFGVPLRWLEKGNGNESDLDRPEISDRK